METSRLGLQTEKFLSAPDSANAPDRFIRLISVSDSDGKGKLKAHSLILKYY